MTLRIQRLVVAIKNFGAIEKVALIFTAGVIGTILKRVYDIYQYI